MANEYDYPVYDAGGRVEMYKEGGKVKADKRLKDYKRAKADGLDKKTDTRSKKIMAQIEKKKEEALDEKAMRPGIYGARPGKKGARRPSPQGTAREEAIKKAKAEAKRKKKKK